MEFKITETEKYKMLVRNRSSVIELAKVESMQEIAKQLDRLNNNLEKRKNNAFLTGDGPVLGNIP